jgi:hypothetical protein
MKNTHKEFFGIRKFLGRYGFFILSLGYLLLAFRLLPDYGMGIDSPKNFDEGLINMNYLLTGQTPLGSQFSLAYQIHGAFFFMISNFFKEVFSDRLGWIDPVSAQHAFLPVLVFFFMNLFYAFLRKRTNARTAFLTCTLLLTTPHFWGHTFNNIKDIPLFVCFSISIFSFYEWRASGFLKSRYLYGAFIAFGLTLLSKFYAFLIPVVLGIWLVVLRLRPALFETRELPATNDPWTSRNLFHALMGSVLVLILLALFFMPAYYSIHEKTIFWRVKIRSMQRLMEHGTQGWNFTPWILVFYVTPVLTLAMAIAGLIRELLRKPLSVFSALMILWFFVIMLVAGTPLFPVYNGIRLFMVFLVPFCFFAAMGVTWVSELLEKVSFLKKSWTFMCLGLALILAQIAGIAATHPYETTFFNRLAGGLKGAQEKNIPSAADYWLTSYREAARWIVEKAPPGASLWFPGSDGFFIYRCYPSRSDLRLDYVKEFPLPANSFMIIASGETCWVNVPDDFRKNIQEETSRMMKAYKIKRQGGDILTIYYKP